ncbi:unnamed protein product [Merluccius merluccius]
MLKVTLAPVGQELVLVLERPVPSVDLFGYMQERGGRLPEHEAKVLLQQVLAALAELHSNGVVHRDVKTENILVETGSNPPHVWMNDLGCGYFPRDGPYTEFREWYVSGGYGVGQLTAWQVGVMLYVMLTGRFKTVTHNCQDLLRSCLSNCLKARPALETLPVHP